MDSQLMEEIELLHNQVCQALGDPIRIAVIYLLANRAQNVSDLTAELDLPQSTVSRHLKILRDRALVKTTRQGTAVYYALSDKRIVQALDLMRGLLRDRVVQQLQVVTPQDEEGL
ncbi:MAG: winged helix-turn-helix transcriptional regulator [Chloroflexi bacterium]|nr:winged helix-turn-helix transcriptional regulator [Chloroflexota bacterium]